MSSAHTTAKCMPAAKFSLMPLATAALRATSGVKSPSVACASAYGSTADSCGEYSGTRSSDDSTRRSILIGSGNPVSGCGTRTSMPRSACASRSSMRFGIPG